MYGEIAEVVVFSPSRGGAVVEHCRKYTVRYGAWRGSRPRHRPWPCGDRGGILAAPAGGVVVAVGGTVLRAWRGNISRVLQARVSSWSRPEPLSEGRAHVVRGLRGRESTKEVWGVGSIVAGAVPSTSCTTSHVPTVLPQRRNGRAVTGVGGRDSGHSHCGEWRPDAV